MKGIIVDEYIDKKQCNLLVMGSDGSRRLYEPSGNGFVLSEELPKLALDSHTHSPLTVTVPVANPNGRTSTLHFTNGILTKVTKAD